MAAGHVCVPDGQHVLHGHHVLHGQHVLHGRGWVHVLHGLLRKRMLDIHDWVNRDHVSVFGGAFHVLVFVKKDGWKQRL
jgi:hypothetical protein